jgi:hypothetical protein
MAIYIRLSCKEHNARSLQELEANNLERLQAKNMQMMCSFCWLKGGRILEPPVPLQLRLWLVFLCLGSCPKPGSKENCILRKGTRTPACKAWYCISQLCDLRHDMTEGRCCCMCITCEKTEALLENCKTVNLPSEHRIWSIIQSRFVGECWNLSAAAPFPSELA